MPEVSLACLDLRFFKLWRIAFSLPSIHSARSLSYKLLTCCWMLWASTKLSIKYRILLLLGGVCFHPPQINQLIGLLDSQWKIFLHLQSQWNRLLMVLSFQGVEQLFALFIILLQLFSPVAMGARNLCCPWFGCLRTVGLIVSLGLLQIPAKDVLLAVLMVAPIYLCLGILGLGLEVDHLLM